MADTSTAEQGEKLVKVECIVNNIWTSRGKMVFDDVIDLPAEEAKQIKAAMRAILKARAAR